MFRYKPQEMIGYGPLEWDTTFQGRPIELNASVEMIDRTRAEELLAKRYMGVNEEGRTRSQRPVNKRQVKKMCEALYNGEYIDGIATPVHISETGKLMDGQHRLSAVVNTDIPTLFLVVRGLPDEAFVYIDQNRARAAKDALKSRGIHNPERVATTAKLLFQLRGGNTSAPRNEVVDRIVSDNPGLEKAVTKAEAVSDAVHINTAVGATLFFLHSVSHPKEYQRFMDLLRYGGEEMKDPNHPAAKLKNKLIEEYRKQKNKVGAVGNNWSQTQGSKNGEVVYDTRYRTLSFVQQAFTSFKNKKQLHRWKHEPTGIPSSIAEIEELTKGIVVVRNSYKD